MALVGVASFAVYAAGAWVTYRLLRVVWADRPSAAVIVAVLAGLTLVLGYRNYRFGSDRLLAQLDAVEVTADRAPALVARVGDLCRRMSVDRPRLLVVDGGEPNAFAVSSPGGGVVVIDRSLGRVLSDDELEAVLAHELAHLERHDGLVLLFAATALGTVVQVALLALVPILLLFTGLAKATAWLRGRPSTWTRSAAWRVRSVVLAFVLSVPAALTFVLLARSRRREFAADARAAAVTGDPLALARALRKIEATARAELGLRGLFSTRDAETDPLARLLATHPATDARVSRLVAMAGGR